MTLTLQNLRSSVSGVKPISLLPGQLCLNLKDQTLFVGNGTSIKTNLDGSQEEGLPGEGWFETSLDPEYYLENPAKYSPAPQGGEILTYDSLLGKPIWSAPGTVVTASQVFFNPGSSGLPPSATNVQVALTTTAQLAYATEVIALGALQKSGGVMTGSIEFVPGQLVDAGEF